MTLEKAQITLRLVAMSHQDVSECSGPQSKLTELNADVKKSFHNLRLRIQVRNVACEFFSEYHRTSPTAFTFIIIFVTGNSYYKVSSSGFRADGHGTGQRVRQASFVQSGRGTQKTDAEVMSV